MSDADRIHLGSFMRLGRRWRMLLALGAVLAMAAGPVSGTALASPTCSAGTCTVEFGYTGAVQEWSVPPGVGTGTFTLMGAGGGSGVEYPLSLGGEGGLGDKVVGTLQLPQPRYYVYVAGEGIGGGLGLGIGGQDEGAGGFNGGGSGYVGGGGGGGASDVRATTAGYAPLMVAAGGGGGGGGGHDPRIVCDTVECEPKEEVLVPGGAGGRARESGKVGKWVEGRPGSVYLLGGWEGVAGQASKGGAGGAGGEPRAANTECNEPEHAGGAGGEGHAGAGGRGGSAGESYGEGGGGGGGYFGGGGGGGGGYETGSTCFEYWAAGGGGGGGSSYLGGASSGSIVLAAGNQGAASVSYADPIAGGSGVYRMYAGTTLEVPASAGALSSYAGTRAPSGDPLSATLTADPSHGTVSLASNGSFNYTPESGFSGSDSFGYKISDSAGDYASGTIAIHVVASGSQKLYVAVADARGYLQRFDAVTGKPTEPTPLGGQPYAVAITPNGQTAYVTSLGADTVTPVEISSGEALSPIAVGSEPMGIAISPDGKIAYVSNFGSDTLSVINLASAKVTATVTLPSRPWAVAVTPNGKTVWVSESAAARLVYIKTAKDKVSGEVEVGEEPDALLFVPSGAALYAANAASSSLTLVGLEGREPNVLPPITLPLGGSPFALALTPGELFVSEPGLSEVTPIKMIGGQVGSPIKVGRVPWGLAATPDGATLYVAEEPFIRAMDVASSDLSAPLEPLSKEPALLGAAMTPDQGPHASLKVTAAPHGSPTSFDASKSKWTTSPIVNYGWSFGDGSTDNTSTPKTTHTYASAGTYTVTVTETDANGTSTTQVFTGQTVTNNGSKSATAKKTIKVS